MKVISSVYASVFALNTVSLACGAQAQAPNALLSVSAPSGGQAQAHPHRDSSSIVVIGLLAGGAALMAGGGHSSSGSSSEGATPQSQALHPQVSQPQVSQPQVLITGSVAQSATVKSVPTAGSVLTGTSFGEVAADSGAKSVAVFTLPAAFPAPQTAAAPQSSAAGIDPANTTLGDAPTIDAVAPTQVLAPFFFAPSLPSEPVASVPEPPASLALAVGSFGLAGLLLGARRRSIG